MNTAAIAKGSGATTINGTGPCFDAFLKRVERKHGAETRGAVAGTAVEVVQECVNSYVSRFGRGDVGAEGANKVMIPFKSEGDDAIPSRTTGLLYGKVQSGKTNAAMASVALGLANGFRCFVVLTSDNVLLGNQTLDRFRSGLGMNGPRVCGWEEFSSDPDYGKNILSNNQFEDTGVVFVSTKNSSHLSSLLTVLATAKAASYPAIVIDDEADHAGLNTHTAKNAASGEKKESRIFESIGDLRRTIPNHIYLQITATPASLLLQSLDHPSKPVFTVLVPPGNSYIGGDHFFSDDALATLRRVKVAAEEIDYLKGGVVNPGGTTVMPEGLRLALCTFFIGAVHKQLESDEEDERYTLLIHLSQKRGDFKYLATVVQQFLTHFDKSLRGRTSETRQAEALKWLEQGYSELKKTCKTLRPSKELVGALKHRLTNVNPVIIDAGAKSTAISYRDGMNILIGGNRMGRGLTIDGLMVTYYGRDPQTPMADTVHQHARMFGYRQHLLDVSRIFSAEHLLDGFSKIHKSDEATRQGIGDDPRNLLVKPVWVGEKIRATRSNVLNPTNVGAIMPGTAIYPPNPCWKRADTQANFDKLDKLLAEYNDDNTYHQVSIDLLLKLLPLMRSHHMGNYEFEDRRVLSVLTSLRESAKLTTARLNVRRGTKQKGLQLTRQDAPWSGFTDSTWTQTAKSKFPNEPTLIIMMQEGSAAKRWEGSRVYLPTLVLPASGFVFMFDYSNRNAAP